MKIKCLILSYRSDHRLLSMLSYLEGVCYLFSDVCSTEGLTPGGGPGLADGRPTQGCSNACPPTIRMPEVYVIAHKKGPDVTYSSPNPKVET